MSKLPLLVVLSLVALGASADTTLAKPGKFAAFQGAWFAHVGLLKVHGDGDGYLNYRIYAWCNQYPPPCDKIVGGGRFYDGGFLAFVLTSHHGTWATGSIFCSSFIKQTGMRITLYLRRDGGIDVPSSLIQPPRSYQTAFVVFCKPAHWLPQCGA